MKNALFLLPILMFVNLGLFKKSFGKFMLVELDQQEEAIANSGAGNLHRSLNIHFEKYMHVNLWVIYSYNYRFKLGLSESEICLKEEGIPDVCLSSFKTGEGREECNRWFETNYAMVNGSQTRLKKCVTEKSTHV